MRAHLYWDISNYRRYRGANWTFTERSLRAGYDDRKYRIRRVLAKISISGQTFAREIWETFERSVGKKNARPRTHTSDWSRTDMIDVLILDTARTGRNTTRSRIPSNEERKRHYACLHYWNLHSRFAIHSHVGSIADAASITTGETPRIRERPRRSTPNSRSRIAVAEFTPRTGRSIFRWGATVGNIAFNVSSRKSR